MPEEAIVRRVYEAKKRAKQECRNLGYSIINSDNETFCFIASNAGIYERKIRVVIDEITENDLKLIRTMRILPNQTKEIWCRHFGSRSFETVRLDHNNNSCQ